MALGSYLEQEGKKGDQWRDQSIGQLGDHIRHECDEIMGNIRRGEISYLEHNAMDVIELGAMLLAHAMLIQRKPLVWPGLDRVQPGEKEGES